MKRDIDETDKDRRSLVEKLEQADGSSHCAYGTEQHGEFQIGNVFFSGMGSFDHLKVLLDDLKAFFVDIHGLGFPPVVD
jgi:hypothetical protein